VLGGLLSVLSLGVAQNTTPCVPTATQHYECIISTIAGYGVPNVGDGQSAREAILQSPSGIAVRQGTVYVTDTYNHRVRAIQDGIIQTFAGKGTADNRQIGDGLVAPQAQLRFPRGIKFGADGSLYIADTNYYRVRRVNPAGVITTVAGNGNFQPTIDDITALTAAITPLDIALDDSGNLYIADGPNYRVRIVTPDGIIHTLAGTGTPGVTGDGGRASQASIMSPTSLVIGRNDDLYIGSNCEHLVRRVDLKTHTITTVPNFRAGTLASDNRGNLYSGCPQIQRYNITSGVIAVFAGLPQPGFSGDGGLATAARFSYIWGLATDDAGNVYVSDAGNNRVRRIGSDGIVTTIAGGRAAVLEGLGALATSVYDSQGLAVDREGSVFYTDFDHRLIRKLNRNGVIATIAGNGGLTYSGDNGHPLAASFGGPPRFLAFDPEGSLFVIDQLDGTGVVRAIRPGPSGVITGDTRERIITVAGTSKPRIEADHGSADGGPATEATFMGARGLAIDHSGNLYIGDWLDNRIRRVTPGRAGVLSGARYDIITTIAGTGALANSGDGGPAKLAAFAGPNQLVISEKGMLYAFSTEDSSIRRIDTTSGTIATVVRTASVGFSWSLATDVDENLYFATGTQIFRVDPRTMQRTIIAGTGTYGFAGDGGDARDALFEGAQYIALDAAGNIYVADNGNFRIRKITMKPVAVPGARPTISSVVNGASFLQRDLAPNTWFTVTGTNLGAKEAFNSDSPLVLGGATVRVCNIPAVLHYNSGEGQINALMPEGVAGQARCPVIVTVNGRGTEPYLITIAASALGIFQFRHETLILPVATHADYSLIGPAEINLKPATTQETIILWCTGWNPGAAMPTITIGGALASVAYYGAAGARGLCQINVTIPERLPAGGNDLTVASLPSMKLFLK
jgi:uncharacterized protein (TIGR03437 family)